MDERVFVMRTYYGKSCAVPLATLVAVRPQAYLMPAAIAAGAVWRAWLNVPACPRLTVTAFRWASGVREAVALGMVSAVFAAVG